MQLPCRSRFAWLLLTALALALIAGAVAQARTTIQFGIYADPARQVVAERQAAAFMKAHPDIQVQVVAVPYSDYYKKLGIAMASGSAWDVFMVNGAYFNQVAPEGQLLDLTGRIKQAGLQLDDYTRDPVNSEYNGRIYALPYELNMTAILYNRDLFDRAGVPYPTDAWTWNDLLAAAQKLTVRQGGRTVQWGFFSENHYASQLSFIEQNGGQMLDEARRHAMLDRPEAIDALQFMVDLVRKYQVSPGAAELPPGVNPFMTGRIAMVVGYSFSVQPTLKAPFKWGIAMWPKGKQRAAAYWTQAVALYARGRNQEAAWEFARYLMGQEAQEIMAKERGATPSLRSVAHSPVYTAAPPPGMDAFIKGYEQGGVPVPFTATFFQALSGPTSALGVAMSKAWSGDLPVAEAARQATEAINRALAER